MVDTGDGVNYTTDTEANNGANKMATVNIREERNTEVEALARKEEILYHYHPAGYGTTLKVRHDDGTGKWVVEGYRYSSCD